MSEKAIRFIEHHCLTGNATKSAIVAGYSERTAKQKGYELKKMYSGEIEEKTRKMVQDMVPVSLSMLNQLVTTAESESVRLSAVKDVLDRAGMKPVDRIETTTIEQTSIADLEKELQNLLKH